MKALLIAAFFLAGAGAAGAAGRMPSCAAIRAAVQRYGESAVEAAARAKGATEAEIVRGKNCLKP